LVANYEIKLQVNINLTSVNKVQDITENKENSPFLFQLFSGNFIIQMSSFITGSELLGFAHNKSHHYSSLT